MPLKQLRIPKHSNEQHLSYVNIQPNGGTMEGIHSMGVGEPQSEDSFVLARNPRKELAREISYETGRRRGKARSQSSE